MTDINSKINQTIIRLKRNRMLKDSFWALLGNLIGKGLPFVAGIFVARLLGSESYGEFGLIKSSLVSIALFSSFGLGITATKFIAEVVDINQQSAKHIEKICNIITLISSTILAIVVLIFANPIAVILKAPHLTTILRLSTIAIVFNAVNTTQTGVLAGLRAFKTIAKNSTWSGVFSFVVTVGLTYFYNLEGAVTAMCAYLLFNCIINRRSIQRLLPSEEESMTNDYKGTIYHIVSFSFPVALQESTFSIAGWLNTFILVTYCSYSEYGIYAAAVQWFSVMLFIPGSLRNVALSNLSANSDRKSKITVLKRLLLINFTSTIIPFLIVLILASFIASFYGDSFNGLAPVLTIMAFTAVINSLSNVFTQELISINQNWYLFYTRLLRDMATLLVVYICLAWYNGGALSVAVVGLVWQAMYLFLIGIRSYSLLKKKR